MIYITGDTHGDQFRFIYSRYEKKWSSEDYIIVLGDFGFIFLNDQTERNFLDDLAARPYTVLFVDGNHENHPELSKYAEEIWYGGKIHQIRKNILHLMRGEVFNIEGKTFFVMGGAFSTDRKMRQLGYSYWEEELPTAIEMDYAWTTLEEHGFSVDYILTHTAPLCLIEKIQCTPTEQEQDFNLFLQKVYDRCTFSHWYFGHWHKDQHISEKATAVYRTVLHI